MIYGNLNKKREILEQFTKQEIIEWLLSHDLYHVMTVKKSKLLTLRWQKESEKLLEDGKKLTERLGQIVCDIVIDGKQYDHYVDQYNSESDLKKRMEILEKMSPISDQLNNYLKSSAELDERRIKLDQLYALIGKEREKEGTED